MYYVNLKLKWTNVAKRNRSRKVYHKRNISEKYKMKRRKKKKSASGTKWYMFDLKSYLIPFLWLHSFFCFIFPHFCFANIIFLNAGDFFFCLFVFAVCIFCFVYFSEDQNSRFERGEKKRCVVKQSCESSRKKFAFKVVCLFSFHLNNKHLSHLFWHNTKNRNVSLSVNGEEYTKPYTAT